MLMAQQLVQINMPILEAVQPTKTCTVDIVLHHGLEAKDVLSELAKEARVDSISVEYSTRKLRMTVDRSRLKPLAKHVCVRAIEEVFPKVVNNNFARETLCMDIEINGTQFHRAGEIVVVADTGFDIGSIEKLPPSFQGLRECTHTSCQKADR